MSSSVLSLLRVSFSSPRLPSCSSATPPIAPYSSGRCSRCRRNERAHMLRPVVILFLLFSWCSFELGLFGGAFLFWVFVLLPIFHSYWDMYSVFPFPSFPSLLRPLLLSTLPALPVFIPAEGLPPSISVGNFDRLREPSPCPKSTFYLFLFFLLFLLL